MLATFQPDWQIKQVLFVQKGDDYHLCVFGSGVKTFWSDISFISEEYIKSFLTVYCKNSKFWS